MHRLAVIVSAIVCLALVSDLPADPPTTTFRYPRVYGATGHLYGPTQAHYQYQKQYGRPWHGYGGETVQVPTGTFTYRHGHVGSGYGYVPNSYYVVPYYGHYHYAPYGGLSFGYSYGATAGPPGYAYYGPVYSHIPMAPVAIQAHPEFIGRNPFDNAVLQKSLEEEVQRWGEDLILKAQPQTVERSVRESTPADKLKSLRLQQHGDQWFRKGEYQRAYSRYKRAVAQAEDRGEAHFRLAYALVALGRYERAVREIRRGLRIDPAWPADGDGLSEIFGPNNVLEKSLTVSEVTAWVREDIRDPDRLFLIGVLLHFDDDPRAGEFFETALRLAGGGDHLLAFLKSDQPAAQQGTNSAPSKPNTSSVKTIPPPIPPPEPGSPAPQDGSPLLPPLPNP